MERLFDAALETFAEIGFSAASVEDICSRGGFTRGAFYSSFRSKDELFAALFARETAANIARAEEQLTGIEDEADPIGAAVERCLSTFRADRTWVLVLTEYRLLAARSPAADALLREHTAALHDRLTALIDDGVARIGVRLAVPSASLARMVLALHDGLAIAALPDVDGPDADSTDANRTDADSPDATAEVERAALLLLLRSAITA